MLKYDGIDDRITGIPSLLNVPNATVYVRFRPLKINDKPIYMNCPGCSIHSQIVGNNVTAFIRGDSSNAEFTVGRVGEVLEMVIHRNGDVTTIQTKNVSISRNFKDGHALRGINLSNSLTSPAQLELYELMIWNRPLTDVEISTILARGGVPK